MAFTLCGEMIEYVALFSGQGAQRVGMAADFAAESGSARARLAEADEILGFPLSQVMREGPDDELTRTSRCQPALYLHGLIARLLLAEQLPDLRIAAAAGLSLGEFTAHACAGSFTFAEGLRLVARRGHFMEQACEAHPGAMAAMIGGEPEGLAALAKHADVDIANFNAPGQTVLSGTNHGIDAAVSAAKDFGIRRAIRLNVAGAYHSRLMADAGHQLAAELAHANISAPRIPVISNFSAVPAGSPAEIRTTLEQQVTGSVRWTESIGYLVGIGHRHFIEFGPGKVLAGLVGKIEKDAVVHSIEDLESLESACKAIQATSAGA